jgi:hypothetical protein
MRICQWSESVVFLLSSSIPESEIHHFTIDLNRHGIVIEDCRYVVSWEAIRSVAGSSRFNT